MKNINKIKTLLFTLLILIPTNTYALSKNETVFSEINPDGSINNIKVTNHLRLKTSEEIMDESNLEKITNLNGSETFKQDGSTLVWKANGKDIYYEGETTKELPIDTNIHYYLDNEEKDIKDIIGKKGNVKIVINLTNKEKNTVLINGEYEEVYTPFMVMAGTIINSKNNNDFTVSNGKVVTTGQKNIITSFASPGLLESLNIDNTRNMNNIEISYYTNKFELSNIYILATPKLLDKDDIQIFDDINSISDSIYLLQDSINQIEDGSNQLKNGTNDLANGVNKIKEALPTEETNLENEQKLNYLKSTNESTVEQLVGANTSLAEQLNTINEKLEEANTKKAYVEGQIAQVEEKLEEATIAYNTYNSNLEQVNAGINGLQQLKDAGMITPEQEIQLSTLEGQKQSLDTVVPLLYNQMNAISGTKDSLNGTKEAIDGTITLLNTIKDSINTSINANTNLATLIGGNNQVVDSSIDTINSMRTLNNAMTELSNGANKLNEGANTLSEGIHTFNNQGIHTLTNYSYKLRNYSNKAEALVDLSKQYKGFTSNNSTETIFLSKVKSMN